MHAKHRHLTLTNNFSEWKHSVRANYRINIKASPQSAQAHRTSLFFQIIDENAPMAPKYSVAQLLALDDPALVQHIKDNRDAREMFDVTNIGDWDEVPEAEQTKLLERLMC